MLVQELLRQARRFIGPTQPGELAEKIERYGAGLIGCVGARLVRVSDLPSESIPTGAGNFCLVTASGRENARKHFGALDMSACRG